MRVLIADGDSGFLEILQHFLGSRGYETVIAVNGLECTAVLLDFRPEIVMLERELLWGGADRVMAQMRENPVLSEVPVILMAGEDPREELDPFAIPPLVAWLQKPFRLAELLGHIQGHERVLSDIHEEADSKCYAVAAECD